MLQWCCIGWLVVDNCVKKKVNIRLEAGRVGERETRYGTGYKAV
jgi:hypothetical protein